MDDEPYISQTQCTQARVKVCEGLILADALSAKGLDSPVNDVASHAGNNELSNSGQILLTLVGLL